MRLKGGLGEDTLAVLRELEDSEGDDEEYIPAGKSGDAERKMRQIIAEMSTNTSWAKLREYVESWIAEGGQDEVDTEGVSTFGPHTDPEYWTKLSRGPFAWWKIPWEQRPLIGTLEMPNGDVLDLREGAWRPSAPLPLLTTVIPPRWPLVPREPAPLPRVRRAITRALGFLPCRGSSKPAAIRAGRGSACGVGHLQGARRAVCAAARRGALRADAARARARHRR